MPNPETSMRTNEINTELQRLAIHTFQQICANDDPNMYLEVHCPEHDEHSHTLQEAVTDNAPSECPICDCLECTLMMANYISWYALDASQSSL